MSSGGFASLRTYVRRGIDRAGRDGRAPGDDGAPGVVGGRARSRAGRAGSARRCRRVSPARAGGGVRAAARLGGRRNDVCGVARLALLAATAAGARARARRGAARRAPSDPRGVRARRAVVREGRRARPRRRARVRAGAARAGGGDDGVAAPARRRGIRARDDRGRRRAAGAGVRHVVLDGGRVAGAASAARAGGRRARAARARSRARRAARTPEGRVGDGGRAEAQRPG